MTSLLRTSRSSRSIPTVSSSSSSAPSRSSSTGSSSASHGPSRSLSTTGSSSASHAPTRSPSNSSSSASTSSSASSEQLEGDRFVVHLGYGTAWASFKMPSSAPPNYDVLLALITEQWNLPISPRPLIRIVDFYRAGRGEGASATSSSVLGEHYDWQRALDKLEASRDSALGPKPLIELGKRGLGAGWMAVRVEPAEAANEDFDLVGFFAAMADPDSPVASFDVEINLNKETRVVHLTQIPRWEDFASLIRHTFELHPSLTLTTKSLDLRRFARRTASGQSEFYHSTPVVPGREGERWISAVVSALMWRSPRPDDPHHLDKGFFTKLSVNMVVSPTMHVTLDCRTLPLIFDKIPTLLQTKLKIKQAFGLTGPLNLVLHDVFFVPDDTGAILLSDTVANEQVWRSQVVEAGSFSSGILSLVVENVPRESHVPSHVEDWRTSIERLPGQRSTSSTPFCTPRSSATSSPVFDECSSGCPATPGERRSLSPDQVGIALSTPSSPSAHPDVPALKIDLTDVDGVVEEELGVQSPESKKAWGRVLMERRATFLFAGPHAQ